MGLLPRHTVLFPEVKHITRHLLRHTFHGSLLWHIPSRHNVTVPTCSTMTQLEMRSPAYLIRIIYSQILRTSYSLYWRHGHCASRW